MMDNTVIIASREFRILSCYKCGVEFAVPKILDQTAHQDKQPFFRDRLLDTRGRGTFNTIWSTACLLWLLLVGFVLLFGRPVFKWEITFGEVLTLCFAAFAAIIASVGLCRRLYLKYCPFKARYLDSASTILDESRLLTAQTLSVGSEHSLVFALIPRCETRFRRVSIALVQRRFSTWLLPRIPADSMLVTIKSVGDATIHQNILERRDIYGPAIYVVGPEIDEIRWPARKVVWFEITLEAKHAWNGEIQFCNEMGESRVQYAYLPIAFRLGG